VAEKDEVERRLSDEKAEVERELNQCTVERTTINEDYLTLQEDTADVIQTKTDLESARARVAELESQTESLKKENQRLSKTDTLKWFLAGGGVFFLGWLIGMISRKSRKKRSSLL
jgi:SH3 domain protein